MPSTLQQQEASLDDGSKTTSANTPAAGNATLPESQVTTSSSPLLNGSVSKRGHATNLDGNANSSKLNGEAQTTTPWALEPLMHGKQDRLPSGLFHRAKLTREDYRNLEFGITGFESVKTLFQRYPVIIEVYRGCPAEKVGLRPGDVLLKANDHEFTRSDMQPEFWRILDGRAGTTVDITVKRHKEILTFQVTRMNIEDIENDRVRHRFEKLLRTLGPPCP